MRYKAIDDAGHACCYGASVLDTTTDTTVCECEDMTTARMIARALNTCDTAVCDVDDGTPAHARLGVSLPGAISDDE